MKTCLAEGKYCKKQTFSGYSLFYIKFIIKKKMNKLISPRDEKVVEIPQRQICGARPPDIHT